MKTIEYRTIDKSTWGDGPWLTEPDKVQYPDEATGLPCLIVRNRLGSLCGYVGVDEGHPLFQSHDTDHLDVHGRVTFHGMCIDGPEGEMICHIPDDGEPDHVWWIGFDCGHFMDVSPAMLLRERELFPGVPFPEFPEQRYKTLEYVKDEIAQLAQQIHKEGQ